MSASPRTSQLHWGGGTPTYLSPAQCEELFTAITSRFPLTDDAEVALEIDPCVTTMEHLATLSRLGFNRISMGLQDLDPEVQEAIRRVQPLGLTREHVEEARRLGFTSVNIDLVYGLPLQTAEGFRNTVRTVIDELAPDRVACFSYAHVPWIMPAQKILEAKDLPKPEAKIQMLEKIITILTNNGYHYVGMDHFAKDKDELAIAQKNKTLQRNFQGYSTHGGVEICAFGMSSISQTSRSYRQNFKDITDYGQAVAAGNYPIDRGILLTDEDVLRRDIIMSIMCQLKLDYTAKSEQHGIDVKKHFADSIASLKPMEADGLLELNEDSLQVTGQGRLFIRNISMAFDAYLQGGAATKGKFSKTV